MNKQMEVAMRKLFWLSLFVLAIAVHAQESGCPA